MKFFPVVKDDERRGLHCGGCFCESRRLGRLDARPAAFQLHHIELDLVGGLRFYPEQQRVGDACAGKSADRIEEVNSKALAGCPG